MAAGKTQAYVDGDAA